MSQQAQLYDVYFTGKLVDEISPEQAQASVAKLFKTTPEKIAHLFNGKTHILKRQLTKEDALKYKSVLRKAGLSILFKISAGKTAEPILAQPPSSTSAATQQAQTQQAGGLSMAPVGTDVLTASERKPFVPANIDTSNISLSSPFSEQPSQSQAITSTPDTSHISLAAVGEDLNPNKLAQAPGPLELNLDDITLAPAGALLEELHEDVPLLNPDTSDISIAPVGADLLEGKTSTPPPSPPDTSHLSVEKS